MREDQIKRLDDLAEGIMDVFLDEADPTAWKGSVPVGQMDDKQRGNRYWELKNVNQVGALLMQALNLKAKIAAPAVPPWQNPGPESDPEKDIKRYESEAHKLLAKVRGG
jgi:hypothetical protein